MEYLTFSWVDYVLFTLMFGLSAVIGIYFGCCGTKQTAADYLLGGKRMKVFPVSMSLVASTLSGITLLGIPAEVYLYGSQYSVMTVSLVFVGLAIHFIYLPVFYNLQVTNAYDYFQIRFDKRLKTIASVMYFISNLLFMPVVIYGPSLAFNQVTGFDVHIIAPVMSAICIFYTTIGGLKAVVWTDTFQFSVTLCTFGCVLIMGTLSVGGLTNIFKTAQLGDRLEFFNMDPNPTLRSTFWTVFIGNIFIWLASVGTEPAMVQRFLSVPKLKNSNRCLLIFIMLTITTKLISCFFGLIIYAKYFDCDPITAGFVNKPDQILPYYVLEVATKIPGLSGLFVAGLFSTGLSTLSTYLNTLSGLTYNNFVAPFISTSISEERASNIMKIITAVLGVTSVLLIFVIERLGTILEIMLSFRAMAMGPIVGLFTLGMLFPSANKKGAFVGVISSFIIVSAMTVGTQIHIWSGAIKISPKIMNTYNCNATGTNLNFTLTTPPSNDCSPEEPMWLYRISFYYYFLIGTMLTVLIGLPVSWITASSKDLIVTPDVLCKFVHRFINKSAVTTKRTPIKMDADTKRYGDAVLDKLLIK